MTDVVIFKIIDKLRLRTHLHVNYIVAIDKGTIPSTIIRISYKGAYSKTKCDGVDEV
jgi:hypothetical protein